jgi:hypothetical protein
MKLIAVPALLLVLLCAVGAKPQTTLSPTDQRIADIAAGSACARHRWRDRGRAPVGYIKGVALIYAKSFCESRGTAGPAVTVMKQELMDGEDALVRYRVDLTQNHVDVSNDIERLRAIFTLGIGEGMRESSGNTTEGRDITVTHPTAANAEAGLFQQSFDSFGKSPVFPQLLEQYKANTGACRLETFMEGVSRVVTRPVFGTGPGADFQRFTRACPAFATEYAMILFRVNQRHFGPVRRHEAEYFQPCNDMLKEVEAVATCTP